MEDIELYRPLGEDGVPIGGLPQGFPNQEILPIANARRNRALQAQANTSSARTIVLPHIRAANFTIASIMLNMLNQRGLFQGTTCENSHKHLKHFLDVCFTSKIHLSQLNASVVELTKEMQEKSQPLVELTTTMNLLAKNQLQNSQAPRHVHAMEGLYENMRNQIFMGNPYSRVNEVQMGQLSQSIKNRPKGALPSDMVANPKDGNNTGHVMAVTTRSGKGVVDLKKVAKKCDEEDQVLAITRSCRGGHIPMQVQMKKNVAPHREVIVDDNVAIGFDQSNE
ncbi:hypothetical protein HAX54_026847 [Datura stramonium]|uniref:Uncharacterized protein n=1 Tax=Datura stramonium TaxID=4076 RepID=A0ABS8V460_DATST|nr:hypothetical protein [Datura stramonium]